MENRKTCLLIEDDPVDQKIFKDALAEVSPETTLYIASDGEAALKLLRTFTSVPDHIFIDINMQVMDGFELLVKLKRELKFNKSQIIVYSALDSERDVEK